MEPSLNTMLQFTVEDTQSVFSVDALTTSHPMSVPVSKRNEVNEVFDSIPYSKGNRPTFVFKIILFDY